MHTPTRTMQGQGAQALSANDSVDITAKAAVCFVVSASFMLLLLFFFLNKIFFYVLVSGARPCMVRVEGGKGGSGRVQGAWHVLSAGLLCVYLCRHASSACSSSSSTHMIHFASCQLHVYDLTSWACMTSLLANRPPTQTLCTARLLLLCVRPSNDDCDDGVCGALAPCPGIACDGGEHWGN